MGNFPSLFEKFMSFHTKLWTYSRNWTYLYCGKAQANITNVIPIEPAKAKDTKLKNIKDYNQLYINNKSITFILHNYFN